MLLKEDDVDVWKHLLRIIPCIKLSIINVYGALQKHFATVMILAKTGFILKFYPYALTAGL